MESLLEEIRTLCAIQEGQIRDALPIKRYVSTDTISCSAFQCVAAYATCGPCYATALLLLCVEVHCNVVSVYATRCLFFSTAPAPLNNTSNYVYCVHLSIF